MLERVLGLFSVVVGVVMLTFALIHMIPGDPVDVMLGESATLADRDALRSQLGLNQSLTTQFVQYIQLLSQGELGQSLSNHRPIAALILQTYPATLQLACVALGIGLMIGVPLGVLAALYARQWPDVVIMLLSVRIAAMPAFWLGPVLMLVFAVWLGWLPVSGMTQSASIVLPALTLGLGLSAILTRMTRTSVLEVFSEDYMRTARAKGLSQWQCVLTHALPAALLPLITVVGLQMGSLLAGAVITETIFSWNGIGKLLVESIEKRDYPLTQACVLVIAISYVMVNQMTDVLYRVIDPRTRGGA